MDNGARVLFVRRTSLPMVSVQVLFDAGSARDPKGKYGLSALTARMLDQGAGDLSADAFARKVDGLGLDFGASNAHDTLSVQVTSLTREDTAKKALDLTAKALMKPTFAKKALARERQRQLIAIRQDKSDPQTVAVKAFFRAVYGDHPYAHPTAGVPDQIRKIHRKDLQDFARRYFVGSNATIAVVGNLNRQEAKDLLAKTLGKLPKGSAPQPLPKVPPVKGPHKIFLKRDVVQANVIMGEPSTRRAGADYFPLLVGNYSLGGGGFSSRLMEAIREKEGLAYSVFSTFSGLQRKGPFVAGLQTANKNIDQALGLLHEEVNHYLAKGPTKDEVKAAQRYLTGSFPLKISSNQDIVDQLGTMGFYGLGPGYLADYIPQVRAVDVGSIRKAMDHHLDAKKMVTVVVGKQRPQGFGKGQAAN